MSGAGASSGRHDAPLYVVAVAERDGAPPSRLCVPAATVVIHGPGCATVPPPGPALPADADTKTPASAANRNATSTGSRKFVGRAADRVVDDVDAVRDRLVDRRHEVGREAAGGRAVLRRPERLVGGDTGPRRHAADRRRRPQRGTGRRNAEVAACRRRGMRAVAVVVAGRHELPRPHRLDAASPPQRGVEVPRADQLLVAVRARELLARPGTCRASPVTCAGSCCRSSRRACGRRSDWLSGQMPESTTPMMMSSPAPLFRPP